MENQDQISIVANFCGSAKIEDVKENLLYVTMEYLATTKDDVSERDKALYYYKLMADLMDGFKKFNEKEEKRVAQLN